MLMKNKKICSRELSTTILLCTLVDNIVMLAQVVVLSLVAACCNQVCSGSRIDMFIAADEDARSILQRKPYEMFLAASENGCCCALAA